MPYLYLAEYYDEFYPLNIMVDKLEQFEKPLTALREESCFYQEIQRIRESAKRDILIFGPHSHYYIRRHVYSAGRLVIRLREVESQLQNSIFLSEEQKCLSRIFNSLACMLTELIEFFSNLGNRMAT